MASCPCYLPRVPLLLYGSHLLSARPFGVACGARTSVNYSIDCAVSLN